MRRGRGVIRLRSRVQEDDGTLSVRVACRVGLAADARVEPLVHVIAVMPLPVRVDRWLVMRCVRYMRGDVFVLESVRHRRDRRRGGGWQGQHRRDSPEPGQPEHGANVPNGRPVRNDPNAHTRRRAR